MEISDLEYNEEYDYYHIGLDEGHQFIINYYILIDKISSTFTNRDEESYLNIKKWNNKWCIFSVLIDEPFYIDQHKVEWFDIEDEVFIYYLENKYDYKRSLNKKN